MSTFKNHIYTRDMASYSNILKQLKPGIPKRYLLFVAAIVWTFAGSMLLYKGWVLMQLHSNTDWLNLAGSVLTGTIFFLLLFLRISSKHITRIKEIQLPRPCLFSFFGWKGYMMMVPMISLGVFLRTSGIVSPTYLSTGYITMGIPLLFSAFRFYFSGIRDYNRQKK